MLKNIIKVSLFSLFFSSNQTHADGDFLVINTFAYHFKHAENRNSVVPGIGWEHSPAGKVGWHVGAFSDSFGSQASYAGLNYSTPYTRVLGPKIRLMIGATLLRKQYHLDTDLQTKLVPLPALEIELTKNSVLNVSGSPEIDYAGEHSNAVMFFQLKMNIN